MTIKELKNLVKDLDDDGRVYVRDDKNKSNLDIVTYHATDDNRCIIIEVKHKNNTYDKIKALQDKKTCSANKKDLGW